MPCHAKCLFTEEAQDKILRSKKTGTRLAKELGVTTSVIRAVIAEARKRKEAK